MGIMRGLEIVNYSRRFDPVVSVGRPVGVSSIPFKSPSIQMHRPSFPSCMGECRSDIKSFPYIIFQIYHCDRYAAILIQIPSFLIPIIYPCALLRRALSVCTSVRFFFFFFAFLIDPQGRQLPTAVSVSNPKLSVMDCIKLDAWICTIPLRRGMNILTHNFT